MRSKRLLELGGAKVTELEALIAQAEQFAWGPADITADISSLHSRLKDAKQWVAQVTPSDGLLPDVPVLAAPPRDLKGCSSMRQEYAAQQRCVSVFCTSTMLHGKL